MTSVTNKLMTDFLDIEKFKPKVVQGNFPVPKSNSTAPSPPAQLIIPTTSARWNEAAKSMGIQSKYKECSLNNCKLIPKGIVELGRKWVSHPKRPSLYLYGNTGSGKTYFATSLYRELIDKGHNWIIFIKSDDMDDELLTAIENKHEKTCLMKYCEVPILFIDDLGVERSGDRSIRQYYKIIDKRVGEGLTTIITSNVPKEKLDMGDRISSRLELFLSVEFPKVDIRKQLEITML